ncbi:MAG TPA: lamin tail domain-containing protein [Pirellulales bacterium]|jgi:hypothetical protein|nr:lamin tail domain-containing protein [Pirellulales bacterium]
MEFERLESRCVLAVMINEFLASNVHGIFDQDGAHSDWIELQNTGSSAVNLGGWYLTDDLGNPTKWQFPSTNLAAGAFLTVFASGKNRAVSGQELHTNFELNTSGGYLALEMPDQTIASSYASYPAQLDDVSYGITATSTTTDMLVDEDAPVKVLVPATTSTLASNWNTVGFDDSNWLAGQIGVGYDTAPTATQDYRPFINTDVGAMMNVSPQRNAAFLRLAFSETNVSQLTSLTLQLRYDDGFVAYLNGTEVARANFTGAPGSGSSASNTHTDTQAEVYQNFNISSFVNKLVNGNNVLAIAGLNQSGNLTDFLIDPLLSAGRNNPPTVGYMSTPTPGAANNTGSLGFVADTQFSVDRGFYSAPFNVAITTVTPSATIRYTLDGSEPTATTGLIYTAPILISTTTNLRAAAFKVGYTPTNVDTETYVFLNDVIHQTGANLPDYATWGHSGPDWAMDPNIVNNPTYASQIIPALEAIPTMSITLPWDSMFGPNGLGIYISGAGIPEAASTEYFNADGTQQFQIDDSIQIQGGTSDDRWKQDKLSFRLKFTSDYGPSKLDFPLFTDSTFDPEAATSFDTLILDAESNNVWTHPDATQRGRETGVQDQFVADLQNLAGGNAPHGTYVQLYIDGLYWGVYYVHERPDDSFDSSYLGDDKDNYDVIKHNPTTPVNNSTTAVPDYATLLAAVRQNMTVQANYQAVTNLLDTKSFIDYMIINYYAGNTDWASVTAQHNWYASYDDVSGTGKWRFASWDAEHVFENLTDNVTGVLQPGGPTDIFKDLMANSEFKLQFADEVQRLMLNGGLLTPQSAESLFTQRAGELNLAIVGESARWGDNYTPGVPYTAAQRNGNVQSLLTNYFPNRTSTVLNQFIANGWFPSLAAPVYSEYGGTVSPGFQLNVSLPAGSPTGAVVYYTLDNSDPRVTGGAISSGALPASGPIAINASEHVKARVYVSSTSTWSPLVDSIFKLTTPYPVRIVELNYHPADRPGVTDSDDMEFVELLNTGTQMVDLNGVKLDTAITYQFTTSLQIAPGQRIVLARDRSVFQSIYGAAVNLAPGTYSGKLANSGEEIRLLDPFGDVLQDFTYSDDSPWPNRADGKGSSLEIIDALGDPTDADNWRSSYEYGGTPGTAGKGPADRVVVNEVLSREDSPAVDAIELLNTTASAIDIGGWYLSDSSDNYKKYQIPTGTIIGAGQYLVFDAMQFDSSTPTDGNIPFALSGTSGDDVWLLSTNASGTLLNFEDHQNLSAVADNVPLGRWPNGTGILYPQKSITLGGPNSGPLIGPVAFSEVMYNPVGGNPDLQYVELTNLTTQAVALSNTISGFGAVPWQINGLVFNFPLGTIIGPRANLLIVDFDPSNPANASKLAAFRAAYGLDASEQIVGGWTGTLNANGDDLQLLRPDTPSSDNPTVLPYVLVDEVDYGIAAPWPSLPHEQSGMSLTRISSRVFGDEPTNWVGAPPTPGQSDLVGINLVHGDINYDGHVDASDLVSMMQMLVNMAGYQLSHTLTDSDLLFIADINGDHHVNNADLQYLIDQLLNGGGSTSAENGTSEAMAASNTGNAAAVVHISGTTTSTSSSNDSVTSTSVAPASSLNSVDVVDAALAPPWNGTILSRSFLPTISDYTNIDTATAPLPSDLTADPPLSSNSDMVTDPSLQNVQIISFEAIAVPISSNEPLRLSRPAETSPEQASLPTRLTRLLPASTDQAPGDANLHADRHPHRKSCASEDDHLDEFFAQWSNWE